MSNYKGYDLMKLLAVVGTCKPTLEGLALVAEYAGPYIKDGWHIITGGADGVDGFIIELMNKQFNMPERVHVTLPWVGFGERYLHPKNLITVFNKNQHQVWLDYVDKYHPYATTLKWGARCLLARDYDIANRCDEMLALPSTKPNGGGTGYTMRVAEALDKNIVNLTELLPDDLKS